MAKVPKKFDLLIIGSGPAGEAAIMNQQGKAYTLKYFINTTFNYPTMAEAYKVAALNGINRLF
jgi:pyruvate/2-oxoglutarate dehydrogenase complex dihydrolipoamide dehydrogenase (E3) component